jgi:hypothetical protein
MVSAVTLVINTRLLSKINALRGFCALQILIANGYIKVRDYVVVLYHNKIHDNWKFSLDNVFCPEVYATREEAMDAAFEALES